MSPSPVKDMWRAQYAVYARIHPDTGHTVPAIFSMPGMVLASVPVCALMVMPGNSALVGSFYQVVNQSINAGNVYFVLWRCFYWCVVMDMLLWTCCYGHVVMVMLLWACCYGHVVMTSCYVHVVMIMLLWSCCYGHVVMDMLLR